MRESEETLILEFKCQLWANFQRFSSQMSL